MHCVNHDVTIFSISLKDTQDIHYCIASKISHDVMS